MLTIFTTPRPFRGHNEVAFRNAIRSWQHLTPTPDIIIFGGSGTWAKNEGARYVHGYPRNERNLPYFDTLLTQAQETAEYDILCLTSDHLIFLQNLMDTLLVVNESFPGPFLLVGRRWEWGTHTEAMYQPIDFSLDWQTYLLDQIAMTGHFRGGASKDYMIFRRPLPMVPPPFLIGRPWYDSWFIWAAKHDGIPIVDGSLSITAIHSRHAFPHIPGSPPGESYGDGLVRREREPDSQHNEKLAQEIGLSNALPDTATTQAAGWVMMPDFRLVKRPIGDERDKSY